MPNDAVINRGIYNVEYFSGAQVALYIGDIWVDEVTSLQYGVTQRKQPLYGYADSLFRGVTKGQVLVEGAFTINFKEAGYLWLILDHYNKNRNLPSRMNPFTSSQDVFKQNIETFIDNSGSDIATRNKLLSDMASQAALTGFASPQRMSGTAGQVGQFDEGPPQRDTFDIGRSENLFEAFEDMIWKSDNAQLDELDRRADDPRLNDFDIFLAFGDFAGDNRANHTIQKITNVHIIGSRKLVEANGMPIQEEYTFIGRNLV